MLLGESNQYDFLGVSVLEALPQDPLCEYNPCCMAENAWNDKWDSDASEQITKYKKKI